MVKWNELLLRNRGIDVFRDVIEALDIFDEKYSDGVNIPSIYIKACRNAIKWCFVASGKEIKLDGQIYHGLNTYISNIIFSRCHDMDRLENAITSNIIQCILVPERIMLGYAGMNETRMLKEWLNGSKSIDNRNALFSVIDCIKTATCKELWDENARENVHKMIYMGYSLDTLSFEARMQKIVPNYDLMGKTFKKIDHLSFINGNRIFTCLENSNLNALFGIICSCPDVQDCYYINFDSLENFLFHADSDYSPSREAARTMAADIVLNTVLKYGGNDDFHIVMRVESKCIAPRLHCSIKPYFAVIETLKNKPEISHEEAEKIVRHKILNS